MAVALDEYKGKIAFNGDYFIEHEISNLINTYKILNIIETGTYFGGTTRALAHILNNGTVHSIEICQEFYKQAKENLADLISNNKIQLYKGSSPDLLKRILPDLKGPVLFYLDAHWSLYWPLIDELTTIATIRAADINIIAIHDFFVPDSNGNAKFGYDQYYKIPFFKNLEKIFQSRLSLIYRGAEKIENCSGFSIFAKQKLDEGYIGESLKLIYPNGYHIQFNKQTTIANRGVAYITPSR